MFRYLFILVLTIGFQGSAEQPPPLVGPIVYGQPLHGPIVFQDIGTDTVWQIDGEAVVPGGQIHSWSPDGCNAIYGNRQGQEFAMLDIARRQMTRLNLVEDNTSGVELVGYPQWSPSGEQIAYSLFDGTDTRFFALNLQSSESELLYTREGYGNDVPAWITGWSRQNLIQYSVSGDPFEVNLDSGNVRYTLYALRDEIVSVPRQENFTLELPSPDRDMVAAYFDLSDARGIVDERYSWLNQEERNSIQREIEDVIGVTVYDVEAETLNYYDLDTQIVSAAVWSPDSQHLALLTWPGDHPTFGAYIYHVDSQMMQPLTALTPVRHSDPIGYGSFQPGWSTDSEWVTLNSFNQGWIAYNLEQDRIVQLAEAFQQAISIMRIEFTSVIAYPSGSCE